jgi:hypothetical protein
MANLLKILIKPQVARAEIPTSTTYPYITQFRYGLLAKNLGEKGKRRNI